MATDWKLIRDLMNTALDACEAIDRIDDLEQKRSATVELNGHLVSVFDLLQSSFTFPENLRYVVVRARHELNENKLYTPESARILQNVAMLCSELIGCSKTQEPVSEVDPHASGGAMSIEAIIRGLTDWYQTRLVPGMTKATN